MPQDDDLFEDILNLEEQYYKEGWDEGYKDGAEAGRIEGRSVGIKKGFEKFLEAGRLQGKAIVWANRIPNLQKQHAPNSNAPQQLSQSQERSSNSPSEESAEPPKRLPPLNSNSRLEKNVTMLYGLVEPGTLSTKNDDESVNDFDSRLKGAQGRLKMIERAVGEGTEKGATDNKHRNRPAPPSQKNENIEDMGRIPQKKDETRGKG
ncbi:DUF1715-domain-containing protein [Hypoxylon fragiforme]|uniref:DUF1715-domain-containing protein n=1 Tax=Hypoxylon fragiforme TaxID=63214 RepID=UPI0020C67672|nr:DUF1715-domain-containing protein [Hypoxylon fragiforme]KAI2605775.1 DUF1715-domain-containing protein [Hypoxylon fragiforme]